MRVSAQSECAMSVEEADTDCRTTPPSRVELNLDIILFIMNLLPRPQLLRMMSTSRILREGGIRILLRSHISLNNNTVLPFCEFMLADIPLRPSLLRQLTMKSRGPCTYETFIIADYLGMVLQHSHNLEVLCLFQSEVLFTTCHALVKAVLPLENLQVLDLHDVQWMALNVVANIRSSPRAVYLDFGQYMFLAHRRLRSSSIGGGHTQIFRLKTSRCTPHTQPQHSTVHSVIINEDRKWVSPSENSDMSSLI
ncbi:hypothetical protein OBBRIDRAFT_527139 [Obba rivulosa]|uniref:F-box domain-containing protein n=1 Tax=Obba rivulosa TaxID=1052685 RepID=A0A8E2B001_9APHY|nr:hypothetical protein OBBRIDRAFT_527139 [Obba rivulosa]